CGRARGRDIRLLASLRGELVGGVRCAIDDHRVFQALILAEVTVFAENVLRETSEVAYFNVLVRPPSRVHPKLIVDFLSVSLGCGLHIVLLIAHNVSTLISKVNLRRLFKFGIEW